MLKASDQLNQSNQIDLRRRWHNDFTKLVETLCQLEINIATREDKSSLVNQLLSYTTETERLLKLSPNPEERKAQMADLREYAVLIRSKLSGAREKLPVELQLELEQTLAQIEGTLEKISDSIDLSWSVRENIDQLKSLLTALAADCLRCRCALKVCDDGTVRDLFQQANIEEQIKAVQDLYHNVAALIPSLAEDHRFTCDSNLTALNAPEIIHGATELLKFRPQHLDVHSTHPAPCFKVKAVDQKTALNNFQESLDQVNSEVAASQDKPVVEFFQDLNENIVPMFEANVLQAKLCESLPAVAANAQKVQENTEKGLDELQKRLQQVLILKKDLLSSIEGFNHVVDDVEANLDRPLTFRDIQELEKTIDTLEKHKPNKHLTESYTGVERAFNELLKYYHDLITKDTEESLRKELSNCRKRNENACKQHKTRVRCHFFFSVSE